MDSQEILIEQMSRFNFSQYEVRTYCALLQKSPLNGHEVSRAAGIPPSKIYETLQRLHGKGAVLMYHSDPVLYSPVPYKDLLARLREQTEQAFQVVEQGLGQLHQQTEQALTWSLTENTYIIDTMRRVIMRSTGSIFAALWPQELKILADPLREAHARGIELHIALYGAFMPECLSYLRSHALWSKRSGAFGRTPTLCYDQRSSGNCSSGIPWEGWGKGSGDMDT